VGQDIEGNSGFTAHNNNESARTRKRNTEKLATGGTLAKRHKQLQACYQESQTTIQDLEAELERMKILMQRCQESREDEHRLAQIRKSEQVAAELDTLSQSLQELQSVKDELVKEKNDRKALQELLDSRTSQLNMAQSFMSQTDSTSAAEVTKMVESLNYEILQVAAALADIPKFPRTRRPFMGNKQIYQHPSVQAIGEHLTTALLKSRPFLERTPRESARLNGALEPDTLIQISVQACMVRCCSEIALTWTGASDSSKSDIILKKAYSSLLQTGLLLGLGSIRGVTNVKQRPFYRTNRGTKMAIDDSSSHRNNC
jgi:hypothetical protein